MSMKINALYYDKDDNLIGASVDASIEQNNIVTVYGQDYQVTKAGDECRTFSGSTRIVDLIEWKQKKREAV